MKQKLIIIISLILILIILIFLIYAYDFICKNMKSGGKEINDYFGKYCKDPSIFNPEDFPWTKNFINELPTIQKEFFAYQKLHSIPEYQSINPISSGKTKGWHSLFLRIFGHDTANLKHFPKTKELINQCPCTTAYFSLLKPGTKIKPHVGIYKGVIRYHLSIKIPKDWKNCWIKVDGKRLHWRENSHLMFDDMFEHSVENNTNQERVVLFLDIKRDFKNTWLNLVNHIMLKFIKSNDMVKDNLKTIDAFSQF